MSRGTGIEPIGIFGDFVKIRWRDGEGNWQGGFVWRNVLVDVDYNALPELSEEQVPWIEERYISSDFPVTFATFDSYESQSILLPVYESVRNVKGDITIDVSVNVVMDPQASDRSNVQIWFGNGVLEGEDRRNFNLIYYDKGEAAGWNLAYQVGDGWGHFIEDSVLSPFFCHLPFSGKEGDLSLEISADGHHVKVVLPNRQVREFDVLESLYEPTTTAGISLSTGEERARLEASSLKLSEVPSGEYVEIEDGFEPIRNLAAEAGITFGTPGGGWSYPFDRVYKEILDREFNLLVLEMEWDWLLRPGPNEYNFSLYDLLVGYAERNGKRLRAEPLVRIYPNHAPNNGFWLENNGYTRDELIDIIQDHISTVVGRYRGKVSEWVVLREFIWNGEYVDSYLFDTISPEDPRETVEIILRAAVEADPDATFTLLFDRNEEIGTPSDTIYDLFLYLQQRGFPMERLNMGMEMHLFGDNPPDKEKVIANMRRFKELGCGVIVDGLDVNVVRVEGTEDDKKAVEAQVYREMVEACLESQACRDITVWGFMTSHSWINYPDQYAFGEGQAFSLFNDEGDPNPAYFAVHQAFEDHIDSQTGSDQ